MNAAHGTAAVAPVRLIGKPPVLVGTLDHANDTDESIRLDRREASLRAADGGAEVRGSLRFIGRAHPKTRTRMPVHLVVDEGTPPGLYSTEIDVGGTTRPVEVRVLERLGVRVSPSLVQLRTAAGAKIDADLVVSNNGNVEQALPQRAVVFFEEANWVGRALVFALRDADAQEGVQRYLDRVVRELRTTMAGTTTLEFTAPVETLAPGAETVVHLSATLPDALVKARTYVAFYTFAGRLLHIEVVVNGAANSTKRRPA
ncbi:MAG: hypothetical protein M3N49_11845 [Candidatus Eremiobacteraeota bacterium]|nr:hypothetical protein [Candidatus Eremiobacteraeota bacterium]